ncbi:unnamed protein product [Cutaneotrichosporon oleaginosum]
MQHYTSAPVPLPSHSELFPSSLAGMLQCRPQATGQGQPSRPSRSARCFMLALIPQGPWSPPRASPLPHVVLSLRPPHASFPSPSPSSPSSPPSPPGVPALHSAVAGT